MARLVLVNGWNELSIGKKMEIVWAEVAIVEWYLLREDDELIDLIRNGATKEQAINFVNENY